MCDLGGHTSPVLAQVGGDRTLEVSVVPRECLSHICDCGHALHTCPVHVMVQF